MQNSESMTSESLTVSALVPRWLKKSGDSVAKEIFAQILGVALLAALAQVSIHLPWTPVPITGQTLGVTLISLFWGRTRGLSAVAIYLALGFMGAPVFSPVMMSAFWGPTLGYLVGMFFAAGLMGFLADRGWTKSFARAWAAGFLGSVVVFAFGLIGLSYFVPHSALLAAGLLPFLPGDFLKITLAAGLVRGAEKKS